MRNTTNIPTKHFEHCIVTVRDHMDWAWDKLRDNPTEAMLCWYLAYYDYLNAGLRKFVVSPPNASYELLEELSKSYAPDIRFTLGTYTQYCINMNNLRNAYGMYLYGKASSVECKDLPIRKMK